jgi:glutathione S-transferase
MDIVHVVITLALLQFFILGGLVGRARVRSGIDAPAIAGDPVFERYFRVHYNTMEQLVVFVPGMLIFGTYISPVAAAVLGIIFIVGRTVYFRAYIVDPAKRGPGFGLTLLSNAVLVLGGLGGAAWSVFTG